MSPPFNAAAFVHYYLRAQKRQLKNGVLPVVGFVVCLILWWNLGARAIVFGVAWTLLWAVVTPAAS